MTDPAQLPNIPRVLEVAGETVRTNFPAERIGEMMDLAKLVDDTAIRRYVLGPPYAVHPPTNTTGGVYILRLDLESLAKLSIDLFGADSAYWTPPPSGPEY